MNSNEFLQKTADTIERFGMADKNDRIMCCLSGGADSVALLVSLKKLGFDVTACHVNHMLRGEESDRDERFCAGLCRRLGVELTVRRVDAAEYSAKLGVSVEEGARRLRYSIFEEVSDGAKTATAHTLSDNIETVLFHLARGTGTDGLTGIPPIRGKIIRPLINMRRCDIEDFLNEEKYSWVTDSTNLSTDYSRNKIRHIVIPALRDINISLEKTFEGSLENFREDTALLKKLSAELFELARLDDNSLDISILLNADTALCKRAIKQLLESSCAQYSRDTVLRIAELCKKGKGTLTLGYGKYAAAENGKLTVKDKKNDVKQQTLSVTVGSPARFYDRDITVKEIPFTYLENQRFPDAADASKVKGNILIRSRNGSDRIKFANKGFTCSIKKLFQSRYPPEQRLKAVVLSDDEGPFYAEGFGFAQRVLPDKNTKTVLICKIS